MKKLFLSLVISCISLVSFAATITGADSLCAGDTTTLVGTPSGGTWTSINTAIATVGSTGIVTGVAPGVDTIVYSGGTGTIPAIHVITVNPIPAAIMGSTVGTVVCTGRTIPLTDATPGGTWSSSNTAVATVGSSSGIVTTLGPGTTIITYTLPTGCSVSTAIAVTAGPAPILGPDSVCLGATILLTDATAGGTWSSGNTVVATVGSSSGVVTGVSGGTATITYTVGSCYSTVTVTVRPAPCTNGIDETVIGSHTVAIFPNPAYDELTVKTFPGEYQSFLITNEVGQVMIRSQLTTAQTTVDIKALPAGLYYIILKSDTGNSTTQKFVKM